LGVTIGVAAVLGLATAPAAHAGPTTPIGPNQFFVGVVNGASADARILVSCDGPGRTGHPLAGQTAAALPVSTPTTPAPASTGEAGKALGVGAGATSAPEPLVELRFYQVRDPIPTTVEVPCGGSGV